jgi:hypothetical protein
VLLQCPDDLLCRKALRVMRALQAYLDHRNIQHAVRYTELAPDRFKDFWR